MDYVFRCADESIDHDELYGVPIARARAIGEVSWSALSKQFPNGVRVVVQEPGLLPLDVLYIPRDTSRLLVGFHGLENRAAADLPKFQFVRSFRTRSESLLFVSDPTLLVHPELTIAWMVGSPQDDVVPRYAALVSQLASETNINEVVLAGHSAGGTAAVRMGTFIENSIAIAVNAQFAARCFEPWTVDALQQRAFPELDSAQEMLELYKDRLELGPALDQRVQSSRIAWFSHSEDRNSFGSQPSFPEMARHFGLDASVGGRTTSGGCDPGMPLGLSKFCARLAGVHAPVRGSGARRRVKVDWPPDPSWHLAAGIS